MDTTLTPNDLFSPSKARQQRAQAQDWASVNNWLDIKYAGRPIPAFERNDDTLKALLALAAANERADEERDLVEGLEREAFKEVVNQEADVLEDNLQILQALTEHLSPDGLDSLSALSSISVTLNCPDAHPETLAHHIHPLTSKTAALSQQIAHIEALRNYLEYNHSKLSSLFHDIHNDPAFQAPANTAQQTQALATQTKQLRAKLSEYATRLSSMGPVSSYSSSAKIGDPTSAASLQALVDLEKEIETLTDGAEALEEQIEAYKGLPANRDAARRLVRNFEKKVEDLRQRRDGMFEDMVDE